ncbi:MAG: helix-turn-helix domain-containing protein [Bacteroidota bacterium]
MSLSLSGFFILASVVQGVFIGLAILFAPLFRSTTNNYLAGFLLSLSAMTFLGWQEFDNFWIDWIWSLMWEYLIPVLLFQYFLRVLDHAYLRAKWLPWLYLPFVFFLVVDLFIDGELVFGLYDIPSFSSNATYDLYDSLLDSFALWWNVGLIVWMFTLARTDQKVPPEKRQWLIRFGVAMVIVVFVWFLSDWVEARTNVEEPLAAIWLAMSLLFWYIAYAGVYQLRILDERKEIHALLLNRANQPKPLVDVVSTPLNQEALELDGSAEATEVNPYTDRLRRLMQKDHLYRNPDLGRQLVAERLGISEGYVSQVVQESVGEGFVEYVNRHRILAAKEMLSDGTFNPYSLEAIGREAGFKSRSAFYESFKRATGQTPGAYRKSQKAS